MQNAPWASPRVNASRAGRTPRQRFITNPSGERHSSRQRYFSGLNCHSPATRERRAHDRAAGAAPGTAWPRPPRGPRDRRARRGRRSRTTSRGSRRGARPTSRAGRGRRRTSPPNVTTSGIDVGSIIATIISVQPAANRPRPRAASGTRRRPRGARYRPNGDASQTQRQPRRAAASAPSAPTRIARSRRMEPRDACRRTSRASLAVGGQAAKRKWPWRALLPLRSTLGIPCVAAVAACTCWPWPHRPASPGSC